MAFDSRTNAGVDQVSSYSKMHSFGQPGNWVVTLLSAGNLATTQAVIRRVRRDVENDTARSLTKFKRMARSKADQSIITADPLVSFWPTTLAQPTRPTMPRASANQRGAVLPTAC